MSKDVDVDLLTTCRTCLEVNVERKGYMALFTPTNSLKVAPNNVLVELDSFQLGITRDDGLPQQICSKCREAFSSINQFRKQCVEVQKKLVTYFTRVDLKPRSNEEDSLESLTVKSEETDPDTKKKLENKNEEECIYEIYEHELVEVESLDGTIKLEEPNESIQICEREESVTGNLQESEDTSMDEFIIIPTEEDTTSHNELDTHRCDICNQGFKSKIYVAKHKRAVHETGKHECSVCCKTFTNTMKYNYHMRSHNPIKKYKCTYCDRSFMQLHHLTNHERTHTGLRPFLCNICGKNFKQESNFKIHLRVHSGERPYECDICGKNFVQRTAFVMHMRHHNNIRPYQCEICGKNFIQKSTLTAHQRTHTGERPYKCDLCDKAFVQSHQLKYHKYSSHNGRSGPNKKQKIRTEGSSTKESSMENHSAESLESSDDQQSLNQHLYVCQICSRSFKLPSSLTSHLKCHSEERKHVCKMCGNTFKRAEHLRIHVNGVHLKKKPYACNLCDKTFSQIGDRNIHMKSHTGDKPHACRYCNKRFKLQKSLRAHERIHTGEKPFVCEICEMGFISYNALAIHIMKHTEEEKKFIKEKTLQEMQDWISKNSNETKS
ncbi:zinc finger protein 2 homolog isoform X3 [Hermetia illucens]|uniref:zinc finger protein 2 homolog isoform X3 n=1 Tax=Hermetia illucens TaxID=343691 RepID=UPI0018CC55F2|nr:zinc finger protein 2 homolog isoform X3 [Hermetia illucens]